MPLGHIQRTLMQHPMTIFEKVWQLTPSELKTWENKSSWADKFTAEERLSIHKAESALVRHHCKEAIAKKINISAERLQIIRPSKEGKTQAPFLLMDNEETTIDISLSHHGQWLAWCFSMEV